MYRILTERKNESKIRRILDAKFDAYTTYHATGRWHGVNEPSLVIEIAGKGILGKVREVARAIKRGNGQDAVLIQEIRERYQLV